MKENVLDVLIYLFDNYMDDEGDIEPDRDNLMEELEQAGFRQGEIQKALVWLDDLATRRQEVEATSAQADSRGYSGLVKLSAIRLYAPEEMQRLDVQSRGFLLDLEQKGILTPLHREVIIDRVMALESDEVDLDQVKWVVLMVLFNMPGQEASFAWVEDLVFENFVGSIH